jgi:hypothetical protein
MSEPNMEPNCALRWPEPFADRAAVVIVIAGIFPRISVTDDASDGRSKILANDKLPP